MFDEQEFSKVYRRIDELWDRIKNHLVEHSKLELGLLNRGASLKDFESLEDHLGFHLPYDIRASLLRHDRSGRTNVPCGVFIIHSTEQIRQRYAFDVRTMSYMSERSPRYWDFKEGGAWPGCIVVAETGVEWNVTADCSDGTLFLCSNQSTPIAKCWEEVLNCWAEKLEQDDYELRKDGTIFIENWAGLNLR